MKRRTVYIIAFIVFVLTLGGSFYLTRVIKGSDILKEEGQSSDSVMADKAINDNSKDTFTQDSSMLSTQVDSEVSQNEEQEKEYVVTDKISKNQYKNMLENGVADYSHDKRRIAPNVSIAVIGLHSGDPGIRDGIATINTNKLLGVWEGITIEDMKYDDKGRVSRVVIRPIYPMEETKQDIKTNEEEQKEGEIE